MMIVNEEYIKEYEEMSLCDFADELVEPLSTVKKDLTKIIYIHYAKERDKNYKLQQENARLKEKIEKAINLLEKHNCENCCDYNDMIALAELKDMKFDERNFELIDKKF